ncbi:MAG: hypothetical protein CVU42_10435 [Chloroflexi bacterium HGW-Chloroflexi-4]|jgi:hypothetical protein|nr:MAG: hypothetical protein CVU42_10435 [Chloroflexi bacterium HGW-Chloroflexi-4]
MSEHTFVSESEIIKKNILFEYIRNQKDAITDLNGVSTEITLISINAAIESAHAAAGICQMMDRVLNNMMVGNCRMIAKLIAANALSLNSLDLDCFVKWIGVDEIYITDKNAITVGSNKMDALGWQFPDDPNSQAYAFRCLLNENEGVVTQPIRIRDLDSVMFKFVGVSRLDQPGIVQVGLKADSITQYQSEIGNVFGLLATEIRNLSNKVSSSVKIIKDSTTNIEKTSMNHYLPLINES